MSGGGDEDNEDESDETSDQTDEGESPTLAEVVYDKVFLPYTCSTDAQFKPHRTTFASWPLHLWVYER
jgi:hypothetical protein